MTVDKQHNIVNGWDLPVSMDQVIWSQGADPAVMPSAGHKLCA